MLRDINLQPVYDSSEHDLVHDLIEPLLNESCEYWRGVGFFTSGWLQTASSGVFGLVQNGGIARIVTSPHISPQDWAALQTGEEAKRAPKILDILRISLSDLRKALSEDTLNALAWMVADDVMRFRFAIPRDINLSYDYHDKVGLFIDRSGDAVAIHGSFNDSIRGSLNGEAFSVFKSWVEGQVPYVEKHRSRLQSLWERGNSQFWVVHLPQAIRSELIEMRNGDRPYSSYAPHGVESLALTTSGIELRPYQQQAIDAWKRAGCKGIFEMATGTGKTFTALAATSDILRDRGRLAVVILVPYLHLLEQWRQSCETFGLFPILCSGDHPKWALELKSASQDFRLGTIQCMCVLAVHQTASSERFADACARLPMESTMLVADEVHCLGAPKLRSALLPSAELRLGLSATPARWFDEDGTKVLNEYFEGTCFEFSLSDAIGEFLTPYKYVPVLTELTDTELAEYEDLSRSIAAFANRDIAGDSELEERLKMLLIKRARVVSSAKNKLPMLVELLSKSASDCLEAGTELQHVLVYCAPGTHAEVLKEMARLGFRSHEFVHTVSVRDRNKVLRQFEDGDIQILVSIHCLDEGVDVPATRTAYFLASTTNPREFVQRRGRVLRKCEGKYNATIYDFLVVPGMDRAHLRLESDLSLLVREMPRFAEFASSASNEFEARGVIRDLLNAYEVLHHLDRKPWEIYHSSRQAQDLGIRSTQ